MAEGGSGSQKLEGGWGKKIVGRWEVGVKIVGRLR